MNVLLQLSKYQTKGGKYSCPSTVLMASFILRQMRYPRRHETHQNLFQCLFPTNVALIYGKKQCCYSTFHIHGQFHLFFSKILVNLGIYGEKLKLYLLCKGKNVIGVNSTCFPVTTQRCFLLNFKTDPGSGPSCIIYCIAASQVNKLYLILLNSHCVNAGSFLSRVAKACCGYKSSKSFKGMLIELVLI